MSTKPAPITHAYVFTGPTRRGCNYYLGGDPDQPWAYCGESEELHASSTNPTEAARKLEAKALIAELRKGDYTLRRSPEDAAVFDSSWEVRIVAALDTAHAAGVREERGRCSKLVCLKCRDDWPWKDGWHRWPDDAPETAYAIRCQATEANIRRGEVK